MKLHNLPATTDSYEDTTLQPDGSFVSDGITGKLILDECYFKIEGQDKHICRYQNTALGALLKLLK